MRNNALCKGLWTRNFLEPQHGLLRQRASSIAGSDRRVQPLNTQDKRYKKKFGAYAGFFASL
jgi:hypothetical protein